MRPGYVLPLLRQTPQRRLADEEMPEILRLRGVHRTIDTVEGAGAARRSNNRAIRGHERLRESANPISSTTRQLKAASSTHEHSGQ
ncbi:hypothetical protein CRI94_08545 [Longibacter salinarum]|uniref:Uncharacterized protein n=2 Tax=Longibacter salinarum TaxID=1850348 RepID=A0A2A8CXJ0_9BACT|nr:hypothetical protein CRI94_08545 [Longibacter salinarum]